jgi:hypothetical protein
MRNLKPHTDYILVTVTLACPMSITEAGMADGINEMLNGDLADYPDNCAYADWTIDFAGPVRHTSADPEEGEIFDPVAKSAI